MEKTPEQTLDSSERPFPRSGYAWYVVGVLVLAYTASYVDRTILTLMVQPIRSSLQITDVQIGLLHGLAFAIFYTLLGIPIGWLADRRKRTAIISVGIIVWSFATALCGFARTFTQLFFARIGVGVGEAALSPAAYSLLSDYFPPRKLTLAMSVYTSAIYIGAGLALVAGGAVIASVPALDIPFLGHFEPWQAVFLMVGVPGIPIALLMLTVREPARRGVTTLDQTKSSGSTPGLWRYIGSRSGAYGLLIGGYAVFSMLWNGTSAWIPTYFIRVFHFTAPNIGLWFGLILIVFGTSGIACGGLFSTWLRQRGHQDASVILGALAAACMFPAGVLAPLVSNPSGALTLYALFTFFASAPFGGAAAAFQEITPNQFRGQVTAIYFFALNLAGIGIGPVVIASITEKVFGDDLAVGRSMMVAALVLAPIAAAILWSARKPYRQVLAQTSF